MVSDADSNEITDLETPYIQASVHLNTTRGEKVACIYHYVCMNSTEWSKRESGD